MKKTQQLDETLFFLSKLNIDNRAVSITEMPQTNELDIPEVESALEKLISLGYVGSTDGLDYYMKFDGWRFLEDAPFFFRNKPFRYEQFKNRLSVIWKILKTLGIVINAVAIFYIGFYSLKKSDEIKELKRKVREIQTVVENQHQEIDSLNDSIIKLIINRTKTIDTPD